MTCNQNTFQALSGTEAFVLRGDGTLWLEHGPFGGAQTTRVQVEANVVSFQVLSESEVFVLLSDGTLWHEIAPFGVVPPARQQVDSNVALTQPTLPSPPPPPPPPPSQVSVPDVVGATAAQADSALARAGLGAQFKGPTGTTATVTQQSPAAGTRVIQGTTVVLVTANVSPK